MMRKLELEIPDTLFERIRGHAESNGATPEQCVVETIAERYGLYSTKVQGLSLLKYAGIASSKDPSSYPYGLDNERIDEDLAREYGGGLDSR